MIISGVVQALSASGEGFSMTLIREVQGSPWQLAEFTNLPANEAANFKLGDKVKLTIAKVS